MAGDRRAAADTIPVLLSRGRPEACAIRTSDHSRLSYGELRALCTRVAAFFRVRGIGNGYRVATLLPNGPEAASVFLAVASVATAAPLNPGYGTSELRFHLHDLGVRAIILQRGEGQAARTVAAGLAIPVVELHPDPAMPGCFALDADG